MNKLESNGEKQFWFVLIFSVFPYFKTIGLHIYTAKSSFAASQIDLTMIDIGEALLKITVFAFLFYLMSKGQVWAKYLYTAIMIVLLVLYYVIPIAFGNADYYLNLSIDQWETRVINTIIFYALPPILLFTMKAIKAFLRFRANTKGNLSEKIDGIGA